jgi:DNA-binding PucR family transcriptional regulator
MLHMRQEVKEAAETIIRRGAEVALASLDDMSTKIRDQHLLAAGMEEIAADPVLSAASLRAIRATVGHWTAAVMERPWDPVSPAADPDSLRMARDLVRRGLSDSILTAYRVGQVDAWRAWVTITTELTDDIELIRVVLDHTAGSIGDFNERTLAVVRKVVEEERAELLRGVLPGRREMVELLLDGAPVHPDRASTRLGLDVRKPLTALVVWTLAADADQSALEEVVEYVARTPERSRHVVMFPSTGVAWMWVSGRAPEVKDIERAVHPWPGLRVAIGETRTGTEGFRASHRSAMAVQRLISRSGLRQVARADDTRLAALLSRYGDEAADFARIVLGDLATAPADLLLTVRTYLEELGNVKQTAERLYTHRNTIVRRLEKADALLPRPLAERPLDTAAALELWHWLENSPPHGESS